MTDRDVVLATAFLRALATGMAGVLAGLYLAAHGLDATAIGGIVAAGLAGAALASLAATLAGDRLGRRRVLVALAGLGAAGAVTLACVTGAVALGAAAFVGMLNGMGRDRGAALVLDQAILPSAAAGAGRTRTFAVYNVLQDAGHALGALAAGLPSLAQRALGASEVASYRAGLVAYAALLLATAVLYSRLSPAVEAAGAERTPRMTPRSRKILARISALFFVDSLAGGFLTAALLTVFFRERFGASDAAIGALFFLARGLNALSHLAAARLAARIGLVNTMVFTHIPSSLLLATVPFAPSFPVAAALFLLREGLVEMDVPTRQSYVMAVVEPGERTFTSGVTHLVRLAGWALGPSFAGLLMSGASLGAPLVAGAAMKIGYDIALWTAFRRVRPASE